MSPEFGIEITIARTRNERIHDFIFTNIDFIAESFQISIIHQPTKQNKKESLIKYTSTTRKIFVSRIWNQNNNHEDVKRKNIQLFYPQFFLPKNIINFIAKGFRITIILQPKKEKTIINKIYQHSSKNLLPQVPIRHTTPKPTYQKKKETQSLKSGHALSHLI